MTYFFSSFFFFFSVSSFCFTVLHQLLIKYFKTSKSFLLLLLLHILSGVLLCLRLLLLLLLHRVPVALVHMFSSLSKNPKRQFNRSFLFLVLSPLLFISLFQSIPPREHLVWWGAPALKRLRLPQYSTVLRTKSQDGCFNVLLKFKFPKSTLSFRSPEEVSSTAASPQSWLHCLKINYICCQWTNLNFSWNYSLSIN